MTSVLSARARSFQGFRAGFVSRALAGVIDISVVAAIAAAVVVGWSLLRSLGERIFQLSVPAPFEAFVLGELLLCGYLWIGWSTTGRSVGKEVMGLRVVNTRGELMRPGAALLRALLSLIFPMGLLWCLVSRDNRSVADVVLGTSVIYDWSVQVPPRAARRAVRRRENDDEEQGKKAGAPGHPQERASQAIGMPLRTSRSSDASVSRPR